MYRPCHSGNSSVVGSAFGNNEFVAFVKNMLHAAEDLNIFTVNAEDILIEFVHVLFGIPVFEIGPETHLTTVRCFIEVSVDVRRILLAVINMI